MRTLALVILTTMLAGCFGEGKRPAKAPPICSGTEQDRTAHAAALARDGGAESQRTGRALIAKIDAGCGDQ